MITPIRGKVARVLNEREIAINIGTAHGVAVDMYFDVIDPHYENIKDPDTNEALGSLRRPKVRVRITHVQERLSTAMTYRSKKVNPGDSRGYDLLGPFARSLMPSGWTTKYETTKYETLRKTGKLGNEPNELEEHESYVNTGDPVVQVIEEIDTERKALTENTEALSPAIEDQ